MRISELHYELPDALVARHPLARREDARLMLVDDGLSHHHVRDLPELLPPRSLVVVNDTRVLPARVFGHKRPSGGRVEALLVRRLPEDGPLPDGTPAERWTALCKASRRIVSGSELELMGLPVWVERGADAEGMFTLRIAGDVLQALSGAGRVPLPPYLGRDEEPADRERYQTTYARVPGAVAAPTAGLHLSEPLMAAVEAAGHAFVAITLHVGPGTFRPLKVDDLSAHRMHAEAFEVSAPAASAIAQARREGRPVVAVGTTVVRALESAVSGDGTVAPRAGDTRLLIQPGHRFTVVDGLMTNFHLPASTLLALVYAFGGTERIRAAYDQAITERYRFYSYGDAMFIKSRA